MIFLTAICGIFMFMFLITIHEGGHFLGAKLSGIKVNEFSVGMGPTIFNKQKGETKYSIRALPIGGYVSMEGEGDSSDDQRAFENSSPIKRFITVFAGPLVNLLFAFLVIFAISSFHGHTSTIIDSVNADMPAYEVGLLSGDKIISVDNKNIKLFYQINKYINQSSGEIPIKVNRNGEILEFNITPTQSKDGKVIGITFKNINNFSSNIMYSWNLVFFLMGSIWESLKGLFIGLFGFNQLSGPIGVINHLGVILDKGFIAFLLFSAFISVNLGFFNLLPIPALDGSKLVFILIEMIIRKPINKKFEQTITTIGFIFLLGLIAIVSVKDIINLFWRN